MLKKLGPRQVACGTPDPAPLLVSLMRSWANQLQTQATRETMTGKCPRKSQPEAEEPHKTTCQEGNNELEKEKQKVTLHADVMDLATEVQLQVSTQLESRVRDLEAATYCTLFVPKESDVTEMQNAGRFF